MDFSALDLTYDVCIISLLMLIAKLVRIRMRPLQNLFIPTALIAGFFGVLLGSHGLGVLTLSSQASSYAGILITVLFATMYLGKQSGAKFSTMMRNVGDTFLLNSAAEILQFGIALLVGGALLRVLFPQLTGWFALMMPSGFAGGHGTAAAVGGVLEKAGWADAVTIGQTFATFGLLGGVLSGVLMINYCARKGYTKVICRARDLPEEMKTGLVPADKQTSLGSGTISTMSMDPLTWHLVLIMVAVGASYLVGNAINRTFSVSVPTYGLTSGAVLILAGLALLGLCALRYGVRDKAGKVIFPASKRGE